MAGARILAFGGYQPDTVVTNDDLAKRVDTNDEWIRARVGIESRRIAGPDESVTDMATVAGGKALAASGLSPADIDLVIVATCSTILPMPSVAAVAAHRLGIVAPGAYDLNAACAGFCYALATASDAVKAGSARNVLVIGAEKMSDWVDWDDRSTCIIFADGAGAAVVTAAGEDGPARSSLASGQSSGAAPATWGTRSRSPGGPGRLARTGRRSSGGRPPPSRRSRCGPASGPASPRQTCPRSSRTRPTCASSRRSPASWASLARRWPTTSCTRGTPRRRPSRWHSRGWRSRDGWNPALPRCSSALARGCPTPRR